MEKETVRILFPYPLLTLSHYYFSLQKYIIDLTYSTAQKFLWDGKHEKAMPAVCMRCISALKCMAQVLCNWCLLISSWLRPALVSTGLNSNFGKGKISLGSGFRFPFTIYQGTTSSAFQHCAMSLLCPASRAFQRDLRSYSPFSA